MTGRAPQIRTRLALEDDEDVVRALEGLGARGQAALEKIETGSRPASRGLLALNAAAVEGRGELEGFARQGGIVGRSLSAMGPAGLAAAAGIGAVVLALRSMVRSAQQGAQDMDSLVQASERLGIGIETLQELRFVAQQNGIAVNTMEIAVQRLGRRMGEVARGGAREVEQAFSELGVSITTADGRLKTVDEILPEVADGLAGVEDRTVRLSLAQKLFDSEGVVMVNVLQAGSRALEEQRQRARELGIVWDEELVRRGAELNREMDTLSTVIDRQLKSAFVELAPVITTVLGLLADLSSAINDLFTGVAEFVVPTRIQDLPLQAARERLAATELQILDLEQFLERDESGNADAAMSGQRDIATLREVRAQVVARIAELEELRRETAIGTGDVYTPPAGDGEAQSALEAYLTRTDRVLEAARLELQVVGMREEAQARERALLEARRAAMEDFEAGLRDTPGLSDVEERTIGFMAEWTSQLEQDAERVGEAASLISGLQSDLERAQALAGLSGTDLAQARAELEIMNRVRERGIELTAEEEAEVRRLARTIAATSAAGDRPPGRQAAVAAYAAQTARALEAAQLELRIVGMREEAQARERALLEARLAAIDDFEAGLRDSPALTRAEREGIGDMAAQIERLTRDAEGVRTAARLVRSLRDDLAEAEGRAGLVGLSGTALAAARAELEVMNRLRERGISLTSEEEAEVRRLARAIATTTAATERQVDVAGQVGDAFTSAFERAILRGEDLRGVLSGILQDLARIAAQQSIFPFVSDVIGSLIPGTGGPTTSGFSDVPDVAAPGFADGGIYGRDFRHVQRVPVTAFLDAPRFGMGGIFGPDAGPAILHRHEEVLTPDNPRHRDNYRGGGIVINAPINIALDPRMVQDPAAAQANAQAMGAEMSRQFQQVVRTEVERLNRPGGPMNRLPQMG